MRKFIYLMATAIMALGFTACDNSDDNPTQQPDPEELAEYTIIYYGHGGGNRDSLYVEKIGDLYKANPNAFKKVNAVVQFKYSTKENLEEQKFTAEDCQKLAGKTARWAVDPTKEVFQQAFDAANFYGADNADMTCPDSLTNYINWAVKAYPAKKYMLIVHDHGGGYQPNDDLPETATTRGMIYDDGNDSKHFTVKSFRRAVASANVRFETIYLDACLMNGLEYHFELQDLCDYVIAATYSKPSAGGAYNVLPEVLSQTPIDIEKALDTYCKANVDSWDKAWEITENTPLYTDMTVTRTKNIAHLGQMLRQFTDKLCDTYKNGTDAQRKAIDYCTASAVKIEMSRPNYDAIKYTKSIVNALPEVYGNDFNNQMKEAFNNCIVAQYFSRYLAAHDYMVDYSVLIGFEGSFTSTSWKKDKATDKQVPFREVQYAEDGKTYIFSLSPTDNPEYYEATLITEGDSWGSTLADTYEQLAFDRAVGWSRWIRLNHQTPNLFCPSDMNYELPWPEKDK